MQICWMTEHSGGSWLFARVNPWGQIYSEATFTNSYLHTDALLLILTHLKYSANVQTQLQKIFNLIAKVNVCSKRPLTTSKQEIMMDDFDVVITTFLRFSDVLCYILMAHMRIKKTCFVSQDGMGGPNTFFFFFFNSVQ